MAILPKAQFWLHSCSLAAVLTGTYQLKGFVKFAAGVRFRCALCGISYIFVLYDLAHKKGIFDIAHIDKISN